MVLSTISLTACPQQEPSKKENQFFTAQTTKQPNNDAVNLHNILTKHEQMGADLAKRKEKLQNKFRNTKTNDDIANITPEFLSFSQDSVTLYERLIKDLQQIKLKDKETIKVRDEYLNLLQKTKNLSEISSQQIKQGESFEEVSLKFQQERMNLKKLSEQFALTKAKFDAQFAKNSILEHEKKQLRKIILKYNALRTRPQKENKTAESIIIELKEDIVALEQVQKELKELNLSYPDVIAVRNKLTEAHTAEIQLNKNAIKRLQENRRQNTSDTEMLGKKLTQISQELEILIDKLYE